MLSTSVGLTGSKVVASVAVSATAVITARLLGPTDRGVLALEITIVSFAILLFTLGITMAGRLHLVATEDRIPLGDYLGLGLVLTVIQGVACLATGLFLLPLAHVTLSPLAMLPLILFGMVTLEAQLLLNGLYAYGHFSYAAACDAGGGIVSLVATMILAGLGATEVAPYLVAIAMGPLAQAVASFVLLARKGHGVRPRYAPLAWTRLLRTGVPGLGLSLGQTATYRLDRYIVGLFLTPAAVGLYSVAATVTEVARIPSLSLGQVLFHRLATLRLGVHRARVLYRTGMVICIALVGGLYLAAPSGLAVVFGYAYAGSVAPLRILLLGEIAVASYLLDSSSLSGRNHMPTAARITLVGLFLVTALDIVMIPRYGIIGAAWASVVGYSAMAALARYRLVRLERADDAENSQHQGDTARNPLSQVPTSG